MSEAAIAADMPGAVFTIWWIGLIVTLVLFVPLAVYLLHRAWRAARSIQLYTAEALEAAAGIVANTAHVPALNATIGAATEMYELAGAVESKLDAAATLLARRAGGGR